MPNFPAAWRAVGTLVTLHQWETCHRPLQMSLNSGGQVHDSSLTSLKHISGSGWGNNDLRLTYPQGAATEISSPIVETLIPSLYLTIDFNASRKAKTSSTTFSSATFFASRVSSSTRPICSTR